MRQPSCLLPLALMADGAAAASRYEVRSPNQRIEVRVETSDRIRWGVWLDGKPLLENSTLSMRVDQATLGLNPKVRAARPRSVNQTVSPPVRQKAASLRERFYELRLEMQGGYAVVFRAYDEGVAYRFETSLPAPEVKVYAEEVALDFPGAEGVYFPKEESFFSHQERSYDYAARTPADAIGSMPAVVVAGVEARRRGVRRRDHPALWLKGTGGNGLPGAARLSPQGELDGTATKVAESADYIAVTKGTRTYPEDRRHRGEGRRPSSPTRWCTCWPTFRAGGHFVIKPGRGLGLVEREPLPVGFRPASTPRPTSITSTSCRGTASST
jgi:alpha-glucosidase